jgi:hypothetical protein
MAIDERYRRGAIESIVPQGQAGPAAGGIAPSIKMM